MPRIEPSRQRRNAPVKQQKPTKRNTPIRNGALLLVFALLLAAIVIVLPKDPQQTAAMVLAPGSESAQGTGGTPENLSIRISEVMTSNKRAYPDDTGAYPDWIEIENTSTEAVSLAGVGLSDREDRILFLFPDMELAAGGRIVVYCDDTNAAQAGKPLHARFKLSSLGETVYLFDRNSLVLDSVVVPALNSDTSYALTASGWIITEQSTPGYPNTQEGYDAMHSVALVSANGLVLNELCASNRTTLQDEDGEFSDWIELYNGGTLPIKLSSYALSDDETEPIKWRFPQDAVIHPGEYYVVFASGKNRTGGDGKYPHTNFKLAAEGETVILSDILAQTIDRVTYDNLGKDVSWGRVVGLDHTWQVYNQPTPGMANDRSGEIEMDKRMQARNTSGIYISEVMSSSTGVETPFGVTSYDWIELVNRGREAVNIMGWGLSDSVNRPRKWQFPDVTLQPGQYLLVFASGLTSSPTGSGALHADFRLSALGETVVLSDERGNILDKLVVPKLDTNNTYGRNFDRGGLFYYDTPTPGEANTAQGFAGYSVKPAMDIKGGLYTRPVSVTLSAPAGVRIRYTLDGSPPTEEVGEDYIGPIELSRATTLRARGFQEGLKPSEIVTETYLINRLHTLPVIAITADPVDLWDPDTGIYADGDPAVTGETYAGVPFKNTTYRAVKKDTELREREANFELFIPGEGQILNQGIALQLNGQYSLDDPQKSLRVTAKAKYGVSTFKYAFFDSRPYTEYQSLVLRNGGNQGPYSRIADSLMSRIVDLTDSSILHMATTPCIVYLNGEYWGQYYIRERINKHSIARFEGWSDPEAVDFIKGEDAVLNGTFSNYKQLLTYVKAHDLNDPAALETVLKWIDVDNYFDFMIFEMYFGNTDTGNIKFYRQRTTGSAQWKWVLFDLDWGLYNRERNGCYIWLDPEGSGSRNFDNTIIRKLLEVPAMRNKFLKRYGELFQILADTNRVIALIDEMVAEIEPEMGLHYNRWASEVRSTYAFDPPKNGDGAFNYWKNVRIPILKNVVNTCPYYVWGHVQDWFKLTDEQMTAYFGPRPEQKGNVY